MTAIRMMMQSKYDSLSDCDHRKVASFVEQYAGILLPKQKRGLIETRLRKRQKALNYSSLSDYINFALSDPSGETLMLVDALTTNKTEFFREPAHYPVFRDAISRLQHRPIKIWSAGCSSGQEPYTLAMLAAEAQKSVEICATDISDEMLNKAKRAVYPHESIEPVPMALRKRYLLRRKTEVQDEVKISNAIRQSVSFSRFNLIQDNYDGRSHYDFVFCRNVMIYFNQLQRTRIVEGFAKVLKPGGLLFIGHSESIKGMDVQLISIAPTIYRHQTELR